MHIAIFSLHPCPSCPCPLVPSRKCYLLGNALACSSNPQLHHSVLLKLIDTLKTTVHCGFMWTHSSKLSDPGLDNFKICCLWWLSSLSWAACPARVMAEVMGLVPVGCHLSRWPGGVTGWTTGWLMQDVSNLKEPSCPDVEQANREWVRGGLGMPWWSTRNSLRLRRGAADVVRRGISGFCQSVRGWQSSRRGCPCYKPEQALNMRCFYGRNRFSCLSALPAISLLRQGSIWLWSAMPKTCWGPAARLMLMGLSWWETFCGIYQKSLEGRSYCLKRSRHH